MESVFFFFLSVLCDFVFSMAIMFLDSCKNVLIRLTPPFGPLRFSSPVHATANQTERPGVFSTKVTFTFAEYNHKWENPTRNLCDVTRQPHSDEYGSLQNKE